MPHLAAELTMETFAIILLEGKLLDFATMGK
jgi:hypothetical protein